MDKINLTLGVALVAIVIAIVGYYYPTVTGPLPGGISTYDEVDATATITTSRQITPAEFCGTTSILIPQSVVSPITITLPAATSTYVACGAVAGGWSNQYIVNESSVAVTIATSTGGSGISFFVASSTVYAGTLNAGATFPFVIAASTTVMQNGLYTGSSGLNLYTTVLKRL